MFKIAIAASVLALTAATVPYSATAAVHISRSPVAVGCGPRIAQAIEAKFNGFSGGRVDRNGPTGLGADLESCTYHDEVMPEPKAAPDFIIGT